MWLKQKLAWVLIVLMSINTFAAVVGDNDGAAFITKAEFESLKNDFQTQINRYNTSLDNKIDGAIASYLAGVKVAKVSALKNLIDNYDNIVWVDEWKLYGQWRKWTSYNSKTESSGKCWFVPVLNDQRLGFRDGGSGDGLDSKEWRIYSPVTYEGYLATGFKLLINDMDGGFYLGARNDQTVLPGSEGTAVPKAVIQLKRAADQLWYPDITYPLLNVNYVYNFAFCAHHKPSASGGAPFWHNRQHNAYLNTTHSSGPLTVEIPPAGFVYKLTVRYKTTSTEWSGNTYDSYYIDTPTFDEFTYMFNNWSIFSGEENFDDNVSGLNSVIENSITHNYYSRGCNYVQGDNASWSTQTWYFLRMMLGSDTNQIVTTGLYKKVDTNETAFDCSTATKSTTIRATVSDFNMGQPIYQIRDAAVPTTVYHPTGLQMQLNIPLWPEMRLMDINSNYYKYNNNPLKIGQGIPLAVNITNEGTLHVTADYITNRIVSTYTNTGVKVDIANKTFTDSKKEYLEGWEGAVNKTSPTYARMQNFSINNASKKIELSIPVKKDSDVWLRIKPANNDGGYYAYLRNLKVELVEE